MSDAAGEQTLPHFSPVGLPPGTLADIRRYHFSHAPGAETHRPAANPPRLPPRVLQRVKEHIEANLDGALELGDLAAIAPCSLSHFARCFRNSTGMTPHAYVIHRRLSRAQTLLAGTDLGLTEIALATGFSDHSHFTRRFHRSSGLTPRAFRFMHR
jgi:transcriptional regulator GlxA family with amidase domain